MIQEKQDQIEELDGVRENLKESYEFRLEEREKELAKVQEESKLYTEGLESQIETLKKAVAEAKVTGNAKFKEVEQSYIDQIAELNKEHEATLKTNNDSVAAISAEKATLEKDLDKSKKEVEKLQGQIENNMKKEENMLKTMEGLKKASENAAELAEQVKGLTKDNTKMKKELDGFGEKFREEQNKRKNLLNELEDMKGKIRVYARIRPFSKTELADPEKAVDCYEVNDSMTLTIQGRITNQYNFDSVFGPESTQEQIFDETKRLVQSAIDGYNVCIFAYGQTGSGKTFTIQGSP